jgi:transitional endoplasmic reticulum ATPase
MNGSRDKEMVLKVAEALPEDVGKGRVRLGTSARLKLNVSPGDIVEIAGAKKSGAIVWRGHPSDESEDMVRMDGITRSNVGASLGDKVKINASKPKAAQKVVLAPALADQRKVSFGSGIEGFVKRGLLKRPLTEGDTVIVPGIAFFGNSLPFKVASTSPSGIVQIGDGTDVVVLEEALGEVILGTRVTYEDVGGLKDELQRVREMIELPLKHPEIFERLGIDPPKGVLLYGPPGTGKTLIAKAVANESGANFNSILGPEIMSKFYGESEARLRKVFDDAEKNAPSIIFIDELDSIAAKREEVHGEVERRVVAQLLSLMDGLKGRGKVIVIGATNRPDAIDPALRRPGRFDREIVIGVPDRGGRKEILQIHTRNMPLAPDLDLEEFSDTTYGFVGADLAALAREAAMHALRRILPKIDLDEPIPVNVLEGLEVTVDDFREALKEIEPSALREVLVEIPTVTWEDVGGLEDVKSELIEAVEWPLKYSDAYSRIGIKPPKGILLYGPPGTGKTLLAKAVASESKTNFIAIKGPEILSKWVGESEKAVREVFKKAKQTAPTIVFLDELDSIAPVRGLSAGDSRVSERIVDQLLTSLDGLESMKDVMVLGATNRLDMLDRALLRAGRFDKILFTQPPDKRSREEILKIHTKGMPLKDVSLEKLAQLTEGYTGADIAALCREAGLEALRENMSANEVTMDHFMSALGKTRPSIDKETVDYYTNQKEQVLTEVTRGRRGEEYLASYR